MEFRRVLFRSLPNCAGAIREDLDPVRHARAYQRGGAVAISVLTEQPHFGGSLADLAAVAREVGLPGLRKDFIVHDLQGVEARAAGGAAGRPVAPRPRPS